MSHENFITSRALASAYKDKPEVLIMALTRILPTSGLRLLQKVFPETVAEVVLRMKTRDGRIPEDD